VSAVAVRVGAPKVGLTRDRWHRYTWNDGEQVYGPLVGASTIAGMADAGNGDGLLNWAAGFVEEYAVDRAELIADERRSMGRQGALEQLRKVTRTQREKARELGSSVHFMCDAIARGEDVLGTPEERPYLESFRGWLAEKQPKIVSTEQYVANLTLGYAGQFDLIAEFDGARWMLDIKTGTVHPKAAFQLALYTKAEFIGREGDATKHPMPKCTRYGAIDLKPSGAFLREFELTKETWAGVLGALAVNRWLRGQAKSVIKEEAA